MANPHIIVIGASAGGVEALVKLVRGLPADLPASVFIVLHVSPESGNVLPTILGGKTALTVITPEDRAPIETGRIYVARPDYHMLLERSVIRIVRGPKENRHRPAVDTLFRSAAWAYGPQVIGVVLTGTLDDGTAGLWAVKTCGGMAVVQDPAEALYPDMPSNAMHNVEVDYCLPLEEIGRLLDKLCRQPRDAPGRRGPERLKVETEFMTMERDRDITDMKELGGQPSAFTCPSCRGTLWELRDGQLLRYRCHTGHAFSSESLLAEQSEAIEEALFSALRALEEKATAIRSLAGRFAERFPRQETEYRQKAQELDQRAKVIRDLIAGQNEG